MVQTSLKILPLENGDQLSREEFERRDALLPEGKWAELIEGTVFMAAALRFRSHGKPHGQLSTWLATYQVFTPGTEIAIDTTVRLDEINQPQPDLALFVHPHGQVHISEDDYLEGAPELTVEISASTASIDLGAKKTAYQRNGVQEYIVWRVLEGEIDWFRLEQGVYVELLPDADGITRSIQYPGLWLDRSALLADNMPQVLTILQQGLDSPAHQSFAAKLP